jgi:4-aminobutyrate aminotransferase-like enzyme
MSRIIRAAFECGLYLSSFSNIIRLAPPLIIAKEEVDMACGILEDAISSAQSELDNR